MTGIAFALVIGSAFLHARSTVRPEPLQSPPQRTEERVEGLPYERSEP